MKESCKNILAVCICFSENVMEFSDSGNSNNGWESQIFKLLTDHLYL